ncbi:MAG: hypothetical protein WCF33_16050 [Pseudonocardiaceae bacterium]
MSTGLDRVILLAVVTAVVSLLVTESYQSTPWLAGRIMQWSVRLRYADNPKRAQVRGEELIALLGDLPTLFTLPTAGAFLVRALAYRLTHRRRHARRESRAVQRSLWVRFSIAFFRAGLVAVCVGVVLWVELSLAFRITNAPYHLWYGILALDLILSFGLIAGILAAIESVIRPSRFPCGLFGGIMYALDLLIFYAIQFHGSRKVILVILVGIFCGATFAVTTMITCSLMRNFRHIGVAVGILVNIVGVAMSVSATLLPTFPWRLQISETDWLLLMVLIANSWSWLEPLVAYSGLGLSAGVLAGFATARIRMSDSTPAVLPGSLSVAGALNPDPSIPIGKSPRQE